MKPNTQNSRILKHLQSRRGWVPMYILARIGSGSDEGFCMVHSRIADLRKAGYDVRNKCERFNGQTLSFYRLVK